ncbi:MAG: single-stranded DNA-binding protein [Chitinophagaceae bacterium]
MNSLRNKVQLIGNLGQDPEMKTLPNGTIVTKMNIATSDVWKDARGEKQTDTQWHRVTAFGKTAEIAGLYLKKGSKVMISGRIKYDEYMDKEGQKRYATDIVVNELEFLDAKKVA